MPRLTQIKETKKGRLALFLDGEFAFSLDEDTFAAAALHQDDELEDWQIEELRKKSETRRALDKAMDYLSLRDHAAGELYQKLCRKFDSVKPAHALASSSSWETAAFSTAVMSLLKWGCRFRIFTEPLVQQCSWHLLEKS